MPPDLSVIILNWNTAQLTYNCLAGLCASPARQAMEIIVVDNASSDGSAEIVRRAWPNVQVIENARNLGFAGGNNVGLRASQGRYVVLLNSDTLAEAETLEALAKFLDGHPEAGAVGPRLRLLCGRTQPFAFGDDPTPGYLLRRAFNTLFRRRALHDWETAQTSEVDWVSGACLVVRRAAFEQTGLLDERFFMYFEDNDWCVRLRHSGWKVFYHPLVAITHLGGESRKINSATRAAYDSSLRYFYTKHYSRLAQLWLALFLPIYRCAQPA